MAEKQQVKVRLIHDGAEPGPSVGEPLVFGIQDTTKTVHDGRKLRGGLLSFEVTLDVKSKDVSESPRFSGSFAHGSPSERFLYLSWKRQEPRSDPWAWRIKIPLDGITWLMLREAARTGASIEASVVGRRPHAREPIIWHISP